MGAFEVEAGGGVLGGGNGADGSKVPYPAFVDAAGTFPGDLATAIDRVSLTTVAAEDQFVPVLPVFVPVAPAVIPPFLAAVRSRVG
jgi:hypothetical protein